MIKKILNTSLAYGLILTGLNANAADVMFTGNISDVGCHQVNGTCYLTLENTSISLPECKNSGDLRWDNADTENGKRSYASMLAAFLTNTKVQVVVGGCTDQGFPALRYYHLVK